MTGKGLFNERKRGIAAALAAVCLFCAFAGFLCPLTVRAAEETSAGTSMGETSADAGQSAAGAVQPSFYTLVDGEGVSVRLYDVLDFKTGGRKVFFRFTNTRDESVKINLQDFCLEGTNYLEGIGYKEVKAGQTVDYEVLFLTYAFLDAERDGIVIRDFSLSIKITAGKKGSETILYDGPCQVQYPEGYEPRMVCEPAMAARAQEQILREDDSVRITLLSLGKYAGSDDSYPVQGIVRVENLSDSSIPVYVQNLLINGYTIGVEGAAGGQLAAGGQIYSAFGCPKRLITRSKITSISDVSIQIMTSKSENTATVQSHSGGTWYPVSLSEFGNKEQNADEGKIVYEDSYVRIGLLGGGTSWSEWNSQTQFQWDFSIVNKQDRDLEIQFSDFLINGEKEPEDILNRYVMLAVVGASSRTNHKMMHFVDGEQPLPQIAFRVQIQAVGSGALYNYSKEIVIITQEMVSQQ